MTCVLTSENVLLLLWSCWLDECCSLLASSCAAGYYSTWFAVFNVFSNGVVLSLNLGGLGGVAQLPLR